MRRILVAVDDSAASQRAAGFVNDFFGGLEVEVVGIHVGHVPVSWIPPGVAMGSVFAWPYPVLAEPVVEGEDVEEVRAAVEREGERTVHASGLRDDETVVEFGDPADAIRSAAIERGASLIVVGSHHKGALSRLVSGSVAAELQRDAPCPVVVVP